MKWLFLAYRQLRYQRLATALSILLMSFAVALLCLLWNGSQQIQTNIERNMAGIDLVIGAKGSPLQLVLSSMYHIDAPTGNISIEEVSPFLNPKHPLIEQVIPMSLGDAYKGMRILGTTADVADLYNLKLQKGTWFEHAFETVIGQQVVQNLGLNLGSQFHSSHGLVDDGMHTHEMDFKVVGILEACGCVMDDVLLVNAATYWLTHGEHAHGEDSILHQPIAHASDLQKYKEKDITSLLIKFKKHNNLSLQMGPAINKNTNMQAAQPAYELSKLYALMQGFLDWIVYIAYGLIILAGLSILFTLLQSYQLQQNEFVQLRVMGVHPLQLVQFTLWQSVLLSLCSFFLGLIGSSLIMQIINTYVLTNPAYKLTFLWDSYLWYILGFCLLIALLSSIFPAIKAYRTQIGTALRT